MKIRGRIKRVPKLEDLEYEIVLNEDIEALVHFGAGNLKTVHLPSSTPIGRIRLELRKRCKTMTKAVVTLVTGEIKEFTVSARS